jgi:hypothetical protein
MNRTSSRFGFLCPLVLACTATASEAWADSQFATNAGVLATEYGSVAEVGIRYSTGKPSELGLDLAFSTLPQAFQFGAVAAFMDLDATVAVPIGSVLALAPRAGFSGIALAGDGFGGALPGGNIGLGVVLRVGERTALRADVTRRQFLGAEDPFNSVTAGVAWNSRGEPPRTYSERDYPGTGRYARKPSRR